MKRKIFFIMLFFCAMKVSGQGYFMITPPSVRTDTNATNLITLNTTVSPASIELMSALTLKTYFNKNSLYYYNGTLIPNAITFDGSVAVAGGAGQAVIWLTDNGGSTGNAVFTTINTVIPIINDGTGNFNYSWVISGDKKSVTVTGQKSSATAIALLGISLLGAPVNVANGVIITVTVKGN